MCGIVCFRKLEDLQNDLLNYSQNLAKANDSCKELQQEKARELEENTKNYETAQAKLQEEIKDLVCSIEFHYCLSDCVDEIEKNDRAG